MATSLFSALSGMQAHQQWIDVIGHNLANTNTLGFKGSRATMASHFARTLRFASAPNGPLGGINPIQIGLGVRLSSVDRSLEQGATAATGRIFDLALEGRGFFALTDGTRSFYTRAGTFGLDALHNLVDQRSGLSVLSPTGTAVNVNVDTLFPPSATANADLQGNLPAVVNGPIAEILTSTVGLEEGFAAQLTGGASGPFAVPTAGATYTLEVVVNGGAPMLAAVTDTDLDSQLTAAEVATAIDALADVSATVNGSSQIVITTDRTGSAVTLKVNAGSPNDLASVINMPLSQVTGSQSVNPNADLNTLPSNIVDYVVGDRIDIAGVDTDGSAVAGSFVYGAGNDGVTIQDLITFIDGLYTDAQATLNASGQIVLTAQTPQAADLLLTIADDGSATGSTQWTDYALSVTTDGTGPDRVVTSTEVYDNSGVGHTLTLTFERQADMTWSVIASVPTTSGSVLQGGASNPITGLDFDDNGAPQGLGSVNGTLSIQFTGQTGPQQILLDFGTDGQFDGLTQFGAQETAFVSSQDGFADGELANLSVDTDGTIEGFYTNGQTRSLGAVGVATFANPEGLNQEGETFFVVSANSGVANLTTGGGARGAGRIRDGSLENSNVDTAAEFVNLIQAQRGFQANARVVSVQDELLAETVNLI